MAGAQQEDLTYGRMRRNVRKNVILPFKFYELRIEATLLVDYQPEKFSAILPLIKLSYLKRWFVREEILFELRKISGVVDADLHIEVFAVYGTERAIGEYKRYLGELFFYMSNVNENEHTQYQYRKSELYFKQPDKSNFIEERI
jgi:hypothetical protein